MLCNRTTDFDLLLVKVTADRSALSEELSELLAFDDESKVDHRRNRIILTYDQHVHLQDEYEHPLLREGHHIRISEVGSERQLKEYLKRGYLSM